MPSGIPGGSIAFPVSFSKETLHAAIAAWMLYVGEGKLPYIVCDVPRKAESLPPSDTNWKWTGGYSYQTGTREHRLCWFRFTPDGAPPPDGTSETSRTRNADVWDFTPYDLALMHGNVMVIPERRRDDLRP